MGTVAVAFLLALGGFLVTPTSAQAVDRYWVAGVASTWNSTANWATLSGGASGASVPGAADTAYFDGNGLGGCTVDVATVGPLNIGAGYTGTITASGVGNNLTVSGAFTQSGGTFTAPTGTLSLGGWSPPGNVTISAGTFNHNNGTIKVAPAAWSAGVTFDVPTTLTINHLTIGPAGAEFGPVAIAAGDTLVVEGNLTLDATGGSTRGDYSGGQSLGGGAISLKGNLVTRGTFTGGSTVITLNGAGAQTATIAAPVIVPKLTLNNSQATLTTTGTGTATLQALTLTNGTVACNSTDVTIPAFTQSGGTFTAPTGTLTLGGWDPVSNVTISGGTFAHNNGTVQFILRGWRGLTVDVNTTWTVNHLIMKQPNYDNLGDVAIASGDTVVVEGNLTLDGTGVTAGFGGGATLSGPGAIQLKGNLTTVANFAGGSVPITFVGGATQTVTSGGGLPAGLVTINKTGGSVVLAANASWNGSGQDLTITAGTLDLAGYTLTVNDVLTNNGTILAKGAGTPITAGTLTSTNSASQVTYTGAANDVATTVKAGTYGALSVDNAGTTFSLGGAVTTLGDLAITAGTLLDVTTNNYAVTVAGNWQNTGTFTARAGTVTLNGTNQSLTGANTFYKLTKLVTAVDFLTLPTATTTTVQNTLELAGAAGNLLAIRSAVAGTKAPLTVTVGATTTLCYVDVMDSDASGGTGLTANGSTNSGNNLNWTFSSTPCGFSGLVGYWKFDGDVVDATGLNSAGTVSGATFATGKTGQAASFDGVDDYITVSGFSWPSTGGPVTVAYWTKVAAADVRESSAFQFGPDNNFQAHAPWSDGVLYWDYGGLADSTKRITANFAAYRDKWTHVAFVSGGNGGTVHGIYLDGVLVSSNATSDGPDVTLSGGQFGRGQYSSYPTRYFKGLLDDFRVYNRILSAGEISILILGSTTGAGVITLKDTDSLSQTVTNSQTVTVDFSGLESSVTQLELSNDNSAWTVVSGYTAGAATHSTTWTMAAGDGNKVVYARITKGTTYTISDAITLDTVAPAVPTNLTLTANSDNTAITGSVVAPSSSDVSKLRWRYASADGNVAPSYPASSAVGTPFGSGVSTGVAASSTQTMASGTLTQLKTYGVRVWAEDTAGNLSATYVQASLYLSPPTPRLTITAAGSATAAQAASNVVFTITAKDANGSAISTYAGPYTLAWTPTGATATTLVSASTGGFSGGSTTYTANIAGASAGVGTFTASDNSDNALTNGTLTFTWYPTSFTVVTDPASALIAAKPFTLTVTAKDAAGATVTRYAGTIALSSTATPSTSAGLGVTSLLAASGAGALTGQTYPEAATSLTITAKDTTYVSGVTITGTSSTLTSGPAALVVIPGTMPNGPILGWYANVQPASVQVQPLNFVGQPLLSFRGAVTLTGTTGLTIGTASQTWAGTEPAGVKIFSDITASGAGFYTVTAAAGTVTAASPTLPFSEARVVINPVTGASRQLKGGVYVQITRRPDGSVGAVNGTDWTTKVRFTFEEANPNGSVIMVSANPRTMGGGTTELILDNTATDEVVTISGVAEPAIPVSGASYTWSSTATSSTSSSPTQVITYEQNPTYNYTPPGYYPTTTTTYTPPAGTTTYASPTGTYGPAPAGGTYSYGGSGPAGTYAAPTSSGPGPAGTFTYVSPTGQTVTSSLSSAGRYDASVSMGTSFFQGPASGVFQAPTGTSSGPGAYGPAGMFGAAGSFAPGSFGPGSFGPMTGGQGESGHFDPGTMMGMGMMGPGAFGPGAYGAGADGSFAPPAGMRAQMEGMAGAWRDSGMLTGQQYGMMMQGIATGRKPEGADAMFGAELGGMIGHEFQSMMGPGAFMGQGMDGGQGPGGWMMGPPGAGGQAGMDFGAPSMVFQNGGWTMESGWAGPSGFGEGMGAGGEEEQGEGQPESGTEAASDATDTGAEATDSTAVDTTTTADTTTTTLTE